MEKKKQDSETEAGQVRVVTLCRYHFDEWSEWLQSVAKTLPEGVDVGVKPDDCEVCASYARVDYQ